MTPLCDGSGVITELWRRRVTSALRPHFYAGSMELRKDTPDGLEIDPQWIADAQRLMRLGDISWGEREWEEWRRYVRALVNLRVVVLYPVPEADESRPTRMAANAHGLYVEAPLHWEAGHRALLETMSELVSAMRREANR